MGTTTSLITTISDPSWFYSSLAQTSAAIVGLIGAVLTTRVVDHLSQIREDRSELTKHIYNQSSSNNDRIEELERLREYFSGEINNDRKSINEGRDKRTRSHYMDFGGSGSINQIIFVADDLKTMEESLAAAEELSKIFKTLSGYVDVGELDLYVLALVQAPEKVKLEKAINLATNQARSLAFLSKEILRFQYKLTPVSFIVLTIILSVLSIFGVLWPLSVLPGLPGSVLSRNLMLVGFAVGLLGLFAYLFYMFIEMRSYGKLLWQRIPGSIYE